METEQSDAQVPAVGKIYEVIAAVAADMAKQGISKDRQNVQQHYKFRGIDDVYNALAPCLTKHGLVILPRCLSRTQTERKAKSGSALFYAIVEVEFDFVAVVDGSKHTVKTFGEAMDSADKATNKAMSAAYKYAAFQAFCIPIGGANDADFTTHEVAARAADKKELSQGLGNAFDASMPPTEAPPAPASTGAPRCPTCAGSMYDNRADRTADLAAIKAGTRKKKARPAWKCENKKCAGVIWNRTKTDQPHDETGQRDDEERHILTCIQTWKAAAEGGDRAAKSVLKQLAAYMGTIGIADAKQWRVKLTDAQRGQLLQKVRELAAQ